MAADPQGRARRLIPSRVAECHPGGLLAQLVYVDLVGRDEEEATAAVLDALRDEVRPGEPPPFPGGRPDATPVPFPPTGPKVSIARLPVTGEHFVGREKELTRLDAAWDDDGVHAVSLVAWGGVGKTALVNQWLALLPGRCRSAGVGWQGQGGENPRRHDNLEPPPAISKSGKP